MARKSTFAWMFLAVLCVYVAAVATVAEPPRPRSQNTLAASSPDPHAELKSLKITILSTMLADDGIGEWGFSALIEADGRKILFDTGAHPNTVLDNAKDLKIDLSDVQDVVLSHFHDDHTTGLMPLRTELSKKNPSALSRVHVAKGIFLERRGNSVGRLLNNAKTFNGDFRRISLSLPKCKFTDLSRASLNANLHLDG